MCYVRDMPQLHLYVSDATADALRTDALEANLSLSRYMAKVLTETTQRGWPEGYFETLAGCSPNFTIPEDEPDPPIEPWDLLPA
jgi:hypothetical protein